MKQKTNIEANEPRQFWSNSRENGRAAFFDAQARSRKALTEFPQLFDKDHLLLVREVEDIVRKFFNGTGTYYVTHRDDNGRNPFTDIKVRAPQFPRVSAAIKSSTYEAPLEALGVSRNITETRDSGVISYHHRVYCLGTPAEENIAGRNVTEKVHYDPHAVSTKILGLKKNESASFEILGDRKQFISRIRSRASYYNRTAPGHDYVVNALQNEVVVTRIV